MAATLMPPRGHHKYQAGRARAAAELYLQPGSPDSITLADVAERYGVSKGAVCRLAKLLREQRAVAAGRSGS